MVFTAEHNRYCCNLTKEVFLKCTWHIFGLRQDICPKIYFFNSFQFSVHSEKPDFVVVILRFFFVAITAKGLN